jgi:hypothetical protein
MPLASAVAVVVERHRCPKASIVSALRLTVAAGASGSVSAMIKKTAKTTAVPASSTISGCPPCQSADVDRYGEAQSSESAVRNGALPT